MRREYKGQELPALRAQQRPSSHGFARGYPGMEDHAVDEDVATLFHNALNVYSEPI